jgi:hypothetical protein
LGKVETNLETAVAKAGMDAKTARKYRRLGRVPSELTPGSRWRTREDCFQEVWGEVQGLLKVNPGLEAKTVFEYLQRRYAGRFADGQLRTLQRRVKVWRATEGPVKEVFFAQGGVIPPAYSLRWRNRSVRRRLLTTVGPKRSNARRTTIRRYEVNNPHTVCSRCGLLGGIF